MLTLISSFFFFSHFIPQIISLNLEHLSDLWSPRARFFFFISMLFTLYIYMLIIQASDFIVWPQRKYVSILVGCNFLFNIIKCGFVIILRYLVLTSLNLTFSKCDDSPLNMNYFLFSFFSSHIVSFILMNLGNRLNA